jgi:PAS domain S-box-containing protein
MDQDPLRKIEALEAEQIRHLREREAREQETRRYRELVDNASDLIFTTDMEGVFTFVNRASHFVLGYQPEEMQGRSVTAFVAPEYHDVMWRNRERKVAGEPSTEYVLEALHKDGSRRWLAIRTNLVRSNDSIVETQGIARDITESRRVDQALRESEERLLLLVRATNDAVWDRDLAHDTIWWNEGIGNFGYSRADIEWSGEWWRERLHPDDRDRVIEGSRQAAASGGDYWSDEYRFLCRSGSYAYVYDRGFVIRDPAGQPSRMVGAMLDVTRQKQAERAARSIAERYELLFESHPQPIFVIDSETLRFLEVNPAAVAKYGYSREEFLSLRATDIRPPDEVPRFLEHLLSEDAERPFHAGKWRHQTRGGKIIEVELLRRKLMFSGRQARLVVVQDVTERRALEHQLQHAQRMEAVGRLAGGVAHDFNNLLTVISGYCELLLNRRDPSDPSFKALEEIRSATRRASGLTQQLLAFSRRQTVRPRLLDLSQVVGGMVPILNRLLTDSIQLELHLPPGAAQIRADPSQLEQVVMNLVVNSRDATGEAGRIGVSVQLVELDRAAAEGRPGGPYVELTVSDSGHGMDEETLSHVFEPFFTTKEPGKGTGLGLSTVYGIVDQSGGFIRVTSQVGKGSTFSVYFPRIDSAGGVMEGSESILLVDRDGAARSRIAGTLRAAGYQVAEAENGLDALELAGRGPFDLLAAGEPGSGMSGADLAAKLKRIHPDARVVYLKARGAEDAAGLLREVRSALDE